MQPSGPYRDSSGWENEPSQATRALRTTTFFDDPIVDAIAGRPRTAASVGPDSVKPPPPETRPPGPKQAGNHLLVTLVFWFTLVASVEVWWLNTPYGSVTGLDTAMIAAGRITGLIAGYLLLVVIVTMSRVGWLEYWFGAHDLLTWHKSLGGALIVLTIAHTVFLIAGYAGAMNNTFLHETWYMFANLEDMISAFVATGIMIVLGLLAFRFFRRHLPYELWHLLHMSGYLVLLLAYGHQFALGAELLNDGFARWYWIALHVFVGVCVVWGRILEPTWFNLRHRFRVVDVVSENRDWVSIHVAGRRLDKLDTQAGQYFRWRFLARRVWWQSHPFSISAAPSGEGLRVSVKAVGTHTTALLGLRPGTRVLLSGPSGAFTPSRRIRDRVLLIAGGSGIAPVRSLLEEMPPDTVLLYRAHSEADLIFRDELDALAHQRGARVYYVIGSRDEYWPQRAFSREGLEELIPDVKDRDVYLCGPQALINMAIKALRRAGVRRRQIHLDPFEF